MDLRTYLDELPRGGVTEFAGRLGISAVYLSQLAAKQDGRQPSPALSLRIESESGSAVTRKDLRDDWRELWPEYAANDEHKARA